jgi:trehalose 6-phosphate synthase/phosphatase
MNPDRDGMERLIIVSNRLPVVVSQGPDGEVSVNPGSGGLVTALAPVLRDRGGLWIGWTGTVEEDGIDLEGPLAEANARSGYDLVPVPLSRREKIDYYRGFSNEIIWPLFHDMQSKCRFAPEYWYTYRAVDHKFARVIARHVRETDFVWIHDYHLMSVAMELRTLRIANRLGFFLHIPWPPLDIYLKLPWRHQILRDMLAYDLIGFQSLRDRRNFVQCARALLPEVTVTGKGHRQSLVHDERETRLGAFPISIDYDEFARQAESEEVARAAWYIHEEHPERKIILGVDRLDYTKGIPEKLRAFRSALRRFPDLQGKVDLVQVVVPSRWEIPHYNDLKMEIERLVGEISGEFTRPGWVPLHYIFHSLDRHELVAYYRTAEILLTTPWKDGMNLVAKEYCAANVDETGVLILSEFAGTTAQLHANAVVVNPHDIEGMGEAIYRAWTMPEEERRRRMGNLRRAVSRHDVFWWVNSFLRYAIDRDLDSFPVLEDYVPPPDNR